MKSLIDAIGYSISGNMRWMHNNKNTSVFFQLLFYFMTLKGFFQNKTAVKQDVFLMKDIVLMKVCHRPPNKYLHS